MDFNYVGKKALGFSISSATVLLLMSPDIFPLDPLPLVLQAIPSQRMPPLLTLITSTIQLKGIMFMLIKRKIKRDIEMFPWGSKELISQDTENPSRLLQWHKVHANQASDYNLVEREKSLSVWTGLLDWLSDDTFVCLLLNLLVLSFSVTDQDSLSARFS